MRKTFFTFFIIISSFVSNAQDAYSLKAYDTRSVNDAPNFVAHTIRADFKLRYVIGVPGEGSYSTNLTIGQWDDWNNSGDKNHQLNFNNGGIFYRNAYPLDSQWGGWKQIVMANENGNVGIGITVPDRKLCVDGQIGIQGESAAIVFNNFSKTWDVSSSQKGLAFNETGINNSLFLKDGGNVGIGTTNPTNKLDVNGTIHSKEVKVDMIGWSDFVFKKEYTLPTLEEVEKQITEKGHLANIPSEKEVLKNGINLGEMNAKLLQKIEELTLYMIEMKKENKEMKEEILKLKQLNK